MANVGTFWFCSRGNRAAHCSACVRKQLPWPLCHNCSLDSMPTKEKKWFSCCPGSRRAHYEEYRIGKRKSRLNQNPGHSVRVSGMQRRGSLNLAKASDVVWLLPGCKLQYNCPTQLPLKLRPTWRQLTLENAWPQFWDWKITKKGKEGKGGK